MSAEENKALVKRWFDAVDTGDVSVVDEYISPDYVDHNPPPFPGLEPGIKGGRQAFEIALIAFSDFRHVIEQQVAEGDTVVTRVTGHGKHTGEFIGIPPTGKEVSMHGIAVHRIANGKLVEHWGSVDALGLLIQMGVVPPPGQ